MQKERNVGLDLLRIVSMLMIVTLHYLDKRRSFMADRTEYIFMVFYLVIKSLCLVSVNCYVLISAYFLTKFKGDKINKNC